MPNISVEEFARISHLNDEETAALKAILADAKIMEWARDIAEKSFITVPQQDPPVYPEGAEQAQAWFAAVYLAYDAAVEHYAKRGFPLSVLHDGMTDLPCWLRNEKRNTGVIGLGRGKTWQATIYRGNVIRFGRLECNAERYFDGDELRNKNGEVIISNGEPVINLHIPEDGPMDMESCGKSMKRMADFFAEYRPDYQWKGFLCQSWLLDRQLRKMLPESANIIKFQDLGICYEMNIPTETVFRVCGTADPQKIENPTSLQRKVAEFVKDGGIFYAEGMFIERKEIEKVNYDLEKLIARTRAVK